MSSPLAVKMRPDCLENVVGQSHLIGNGKILNKILESGKIPNMLFYGPSGIGKTTVAKILAAKTDMTFFAVNATNAGTADLKAVFSEIGTLGAAKGILLYLDEIQYLNKKQQQTLLQYIENGDITLIASTTENPYFYVYNAILSRLTVFEFKPITPSEIAKAIKRAISLYESDENVSVEISEEDIEYISYSAGGDVRKALNAVELSLLTATVKGETLTVNSDTVKTVAQKSSERYDRDGDRHYDILSAFQKSIRGSDENAALYYLALLIGAGDLPSICRRLLVIAAEDIGLAYPQAISIVKSCVDSALQLGFPEARIPLAEAVILLATAPKSNSAICAIDAALADSRSSLCDIPAHLKDSHYSGSKKLGHGISYKYPHDFPNHYTKQQYLPDELKNKKYYEFGNNKTEQLAKAYWDEIKK